MMSKFSRKILAAIGVLAAAMCVALGHVFAAVGEEKSVVWQSCQLPEFAKWFAADDMPEGLQCGFVVAPLMYPSGLFHHFGKNEQTVRIAITRLPALGLKKGSFVAISGGPGQPGINPPFALEGKLGRELRENFDIIGYDPRGVGRSVPRISCALGSGEEGKVETNVVLGPSLLARSEEQSAYEYVSNCVKATGLKVLAHIGTQEAVNDVEAIRYALHEDKLTILASSYGTHVGAMYAERYPASVRAMVLDGVVDVTEDNLTMRLNQERGYQVTFERFAARCQSWQNCPLPGDPAAAAAKFKQLMAYLDSSSHRTKQGVIVTSSDLVNASVATLLWSTDWPKLAEAMSQISKGQVDAIKILSDDDSAGSADALTAITCADSASPTSDLDEQKRRSRRIAETSRYTDVKNNEFSTDYCDVWPFSGRITPHVPLRSPALPDLLFVAQRFDPTTPYVNARRMADYFRSPLITKEGDGHTLALSGTDKCIDNEILQYIINPEVKRGDKVCG